MYAVMTLISRVAQFSKPVQIKSDIISMFLRSDKKKNNIANIAWQMRRRVPNFFLVIALYLIDLRLVRGLVNDKFEAIEK